VTRACSSALLRGLKPLLSRQDRDLETELSEVWRDVLAIGSLEPSDDFFDLGGDSLLALRLCHELAARGHQRLEVSDIYRHPTVRQQVQLLSQPALVDWLERKEGANEGAQETGSWLRPMQTAGDRAPIFLINTNDLVDFAQYLPADQPLYLLDTYLHGRHSAPLIGNTIERMAERYLGELRAVRPRGPYVLGGLCFGSILALELARRLRDSGEEVSLLFLVHPPPQLRSGKRGFLRDCWIDMANRNPKRVLWRSLLLPQAVAFQTLGHIFPLERHIWLSAAMSVWAIEKYEFKPYDGRAVVVCDSPARPKSRKAGTMICEGADFFEIDVGGEHRRFAREPAFGEWLRILARYAVQDPEGPPDASTAP
jgi:thioesterase domain-containing protein